MFTYSTVKELREAIFKIRKKGKNIGFVPTMGALHEGHLALIRASKKDNDITICSIFVNPIQFNNASDLEKYPKVLESDQLFLQSVDCDILFTPSVEEMYPFGNPEMTLNFGYQNTILEGQYRAGHFSGVGIVVSKLFNIVQPDQAYFGQKDFQQCLVVNQMVRELSIPIKINIIETVREIDGLAMSSRNKRLTIDERKRAPIIYHVLQSSANELLIVTLEQIKRKVAERLRNEALQIEYLDFVDFESGKLVEEVSKGHKYVICIAAYLGEVRLIDNVIVNT